MFSIHPIEPQGDPRRYWRGFVETQKITPYLTSKVWSVCIWKDGRRREQNFITAKWGALDFDDGRYTLAQAKKDWNKCIHVIGTTKSHQVAKSGKEPCDRFRILFPWSEPITDLRSYRWNMSQLVEKYGADEKCIDGARFYWPCSKITSIQTKGELIEIEHKAPPHFEQPISREDYVQKLKYKRENYQQALPTYIYKFLYHGQLFGAQQSRNVCCYTSARFLLEIGWSHQRVLSALLDTPISREGFREQEIHTAVASAERSIVSILNPGVSNHESSRRRQG